MSNGQPDQNTSTDSGPNPAKNRAGLWGETMGVDRLENLACQLAESHAVSRHPRRRPPLIDHLREQEALLRDAHHYFAREPAEQPTLSYAAEWLLDNFHVVQQTLHQVSEDMPAGYYRQLPKLATSSLEGHPRIYALAREIIRYCESNLDIDQVRQFAQAYQRIVPLTMGELWALPTMLRLGVLENLTQAVANITDLGTSDDTGPPPPQGQMDETAIANCILSLRLLATQDWKDFFESISRVEQVLRRDPANIYARMDFDTRDQYRGVIEDLAQTTGCDEEEIARETIRLAEKARQGKKKQPRTTHVGFYLLDAGRAQLEASLGHHPSWGMRLSRWLSSHPTLIYLGTITLLTTIILLGPVWYALVTAGTPAQLIGVGLLTLLPATAVAVNLVNWLITITVPPRVLPRLDFEKDIPAGCSTMIVVPTLLTDASGVKSLLRQLELCLLGNSYPRLHFALLTDFTDAPQEHMPGDEALLKQTQAGIQALNKKHARGSPGPFYLFHRDRKLNPGEDCWMGWERKRGKLIEFNRLLSGSKETTYSVQMGDLNVLPEIKYVITLDADTSLPRGSACRLIATLAHPLNRAEFDPDSSAVVAGYTVLQPRVEIKPTSANQSLFTRVFAQDTGVDLYTRAISDVYQDLFSEGLYAGKGIYDVDAFERSLAGRVPENTLLSHDLFEGIHGRAGLVTDVNLFEDYPPHYLVYVRRLHRWVRGDWQLLPWLRPRVPCASGGRIPNTLSVLNRWKILDNLRRSLLTPALLTLLLAGWLWLPGSPLVWTLGGLLTLAMPIFTGVATTLLQELHRASLAGIRQSVQSIVTALLRGSWITSLTNTALAAWMDAARWLLACVFLLYEALVTVDAIGCTLVRLIITHKRRLQWITNAHTVRLFGKEMKVALIWKQMGAAPILSLELAALIALVNPAALPVAAPLLLAWLLSPQIAHWIGRPIVHEQIPLSAHQHQQLHRLARRTWLYFEQFVGPDDYWLPPDHFQEDPRERVAHRTSPTNVGLLLLSTLAAYDLGYIGLTELALRLRDTFGSMRRLEQHRGHFLNWYSTHTLEPLSPRYVSTVDSGNLAGCLLALKQGLQDLPHAPVLHWQRWQGLLDTLNVLAEIVERLEGLGLEEAAAPLEAYIAQIRQGILDVQTAPERWFPLLARLNDKDWQQMEQLLMSLVEAGSHILDAATLRDLRLWSGRVRRQLLNMRDEQELLLPWLGPLNQPPALFTQAQTDPAITAAWRALQDALPATPRLDKVPEVCRAGRAQLDYLQSLLSSSLSAVQEAHAWCTHLAERLYSAYMIAGSALAGYQDLSTLADVYFKAMDFGFLFDTQRQVFHLGYNVAAGELDSNHYDLLASEARLASLLAIAKGDIPQSHWLHLARPISQVDGTRVLLSWNGSMFEYLMPSLLVQSYENTLLDQTCRAVVAYQIAYARQKDVPWGISEAGYYAFDTNMNYQYRGFGVPGLGFKRGLGEDLVISPYASLLALPLCPQDVMQNIVHLTEQHMLGPYGFYEAVDYTRSRLPLGQRSKIVRSYMVHHQGMILLTLANYLQDDVMIRRFHADPRVQSADLLLHEQVPRQVYIEQPHPEEASIVRPVQPRLAAEPWPAPVDAPLPQVHLLSNGRYGLLITSAGGGYSQWRGVNLTRWRADTTLDNWGTWLYIQDVDNDDLWSAGWQPTGSPPESQEVLFYAHEVEFRRRDHDISLRMEITVSPDDDVEIRRLTLTNHSGQRRRLMLTSYSEVVLAPQASDGRHQAFNKLFIESEYLPEINGLLFHRRPRSAEEEPIYLAHLMIPAYLAIVGRGDRITGAHESDRARFLGRGRTARSPEILFPPIGGEERRGGYSGTSGPTLDSILALGQKITPGSRAFGLSGTTGATLDPIMALSQEITLEAHATAQVAYITLAAESRQEALALAYRHQAWPVIGRAFDQARSQSELELRQLGLTITELEHIQQLLSVLLYPHPALRASRATLAVNSRGQSGLWPYAISGDYPILLVRIGNQEETGLVRELLQAHAYWRNRQSKIDLVVLNQKDAGYAQDLQDQLHRLITRTGNDTWLNQRGGIFLLRAELMNETDQVLLETAARAILEGEKGRLAEQLGRLRKQPARLPRFVSTLTSPLEDAREETSLLTPSVARPTDLLFDNGLGGFNTDGREYIIYLEPDQRTPAPWINVIANANFGFLVSEAGSGYTWAGNSGENRLTPWYNDPVTDTPGEALYLRDEEIGRVWSPTPLPAGAPVPYLIRHGAGYSIFEHHSHGLKQKLRLFAIPDAPVKVIQLRLDNTWNRNRRITATFYAEWVLGTTRETTQQYIIPEFDAESLALLARNPYNEEFGERVAFLAASKEPHGLTTDRTEFLGRRGDLSHPAALDRVGLSGTVKAGLDPCAGLQVHVYLPPQGSTEIYFLLGQGADRQETLRLVKQYQDPAQVEAAWETMHQVWDELLGSVTVRTPDPAMDLLLNRWLLYQALSCRVWGRSALYQSSGAFGFRDQLQDVMALVYATPDLARDHILRAAGHQFEEGDVLHWWHPPTKRGVRTRCSDDLLWLPFVTTHYVAATGDDALLAMSVPFLKGVPLDPEEEERYGQYETATEARTLYEHCCRALEKGSTAGPHGLPLMGSGDWNDGMNRVGIGGHGESVWLGWFLYATLARFAPLCERMGDKERAAMYRKRAYDLLQALETHAWDGNWYRRAYYDDGTLLGSAENDECQIDSIAQSWAVLSGAADPARAAQAMEAVAERLVRPDDQLVLLFTPPFDKTRHDPGYIRGYLPGIRENGGQYTHAALWAAWAFAELGQGDRAAALFRLLNPIYHSDWPEKVARYRVEPYVVAADVYSVPPHTGRGGWTWYTGSASWMYRLGVEAILGVRRRGNILRIDPCIPKNWPGYELTYHHGPTAYHIRVENPDGLNRGVKQVTLDGGIWPGGDIPLLDDGRQYSVRILMG
ncbi:MAG: glucoamylase family protein [Chloroflexota bacterium]|nr:glucoamylase family protein [Chloroflexota bacterium]